MQGELFYGVKDKGAIPLRCISEAQWLDDEKNWSTQEKNVFAARDFSGKLGEQCLTFNDAGEIKQAFIGSGSGGQDLALANAATLLPVASYILQEKLMPNAALHWALAQYCFTRYKKIEIKPRRLIVPEQDLKSTLIMVDAIFLVRDLINTPTNDMGPQHLAEIMQNLATTHDAYFEQWVGDELLEHNFPAIHAVGRASALAPRLLSITWGQKDHPRLSLIGKGVCFDSGGLDIKSSSGMRLMKKDMGGAAHVIGLAQWIMANQLPVRLHVLVPAVENAVGSNAFRPGDVLTMRNGLTVEVDNTDAEGRLILADALVKACEEKPELIIDFATLTGAARSAVGTDIAAMFSNDNTLVRDLIDASQQTADHLWHMPLHMDYEINLKSSIADLANCSDTPYAGATIAALFLHYFINKSTPWVHFDIMAWNLSNRPGKPEGGEALGLRAVAQYLLTKYGS